MNKYKTIGKVKKKHKIIGKGKIQYLKGNLQNSLEKKNDFKGHNSVLFS